MENLEREQLLSGRILYVYRYVYLRLQDAVLWLEVGSASHTFSKPIHV